MSRPLRLELAGGLYHVTSRGDGREDIYLDEEDRLSWLEVFGEVCGRFEWRCHGWCQMSNHYRVIVETPQANLSAGMRQLNGVYTQRVNLRHARVGHVFQGRFKGILVERDAYLLELARYVVLNPVRARMVKQVGQWPWSSYRAMIGQETPPPWLETDWVLGQFARRRSLAVERYADFLAQGISASGVWEQLKGQIFLGSERFVASMQARIGADALREVPRAQRRRPLPSLARFAQDAPTREEAMARAHLEGGYTQAAIAAHFGVHYSTVSRAVRRYEASGRAE